MTLISLCKAQRKENFKTCAEKTWLRGEQSVYYSVKFIKIQCWYFLPVSHSWGKGNHFHSHPRPTVCLHHPEITTSGQLERSRAESLTKACWEFCTRPPVRREMSGRGPVFGAELEVLDVYHACCSQPAVRSHLLDSCGMVAWHFSVLRSCKYIVAEVCVHFGTDFCGALLQCVYVENRFEWNFR